MKIFPLVFFFFSIFSFFGFDTKPPSPTPLTNASITPIEDNRAKVIHEVFDKLKRSLGLSSSDKPNLEFVKAFPHPDGALKGAMINYEKQTVYFKLATYNVCRKFGKDSTNVMAFLLGHELAHFVRNHTVKNHFTTEFNEDLSELTFKKIKSKPSKDAKKQVITALAHSLTTETEREADLDGGFIAYLSGYEPYAVGTTFLDSLFKYLNIPPTSDTYPSLEERKEITSRVKTKLAELINYFETANLLTAHQEYDDALYYYQEILKDFQSREIYNNIGVLYLLSFIDKEPPKYLYPVELDINMRKITRGTDRIDSLKKLLLKAIENFEFAITKDLDYPIAHINKGCAHALLATLEKDQLVKQEQFAIARASALSSLVIASKDDSGRWDNTKSDAVTLQGIIEAEVGNKNEAISFFDKAIGLPPDSSLPTVNKNILLTDESNIDKSSSILNITEKIKGKTISDLGLDTEDLVKNVPNLNGHKLELYHKHFKNDHARLLYQRVANSDEKIRFASFYITDMDFPKTETTSKGIKVGDSRQAIIDKYNHPNREIGLGDGSWLIYRTQKTSNIIFQLDAEGKLKRWVISEYDGSFRHR